MAWYYFFIHRCVPPPHWVPSHVKGPQFLAESDARRYAEDLTYYSGRTDEPLIVNTWRHHGRPQDRWEDLGWSAQSCP